MLTGAMPRIVDAGSTANGDGAWFARWRSVELARLDASGTTYLDYTGAALYPESLVRRDADRLLGAVLGNPHSESVASRQATDDLTSARDAILAFLNADPDEYSAILTANTTAACRLVGESFGFGPQVPLILSADNHNSVNGLREFARRAGAPVYTLPLDDELRLDTPRAALERTAGRGLVAFPAQSNFSGVRHPLALIAEIQALGHGVLLDAAAFVPTGVLDLSAVKPDFVTLSLYKIAGYPTGVGALVARRRALAELTRPWFAGGTVDWVTIGSSRHRFRTGPEQFEDGTPSFVAAGAVRMALAAVIYADRERLARHLGALTGQLLHRLPELQHSNGSSLVTVHGPADTRDRGATIAITLHDDIRRAIPFWEVEAAARESGIALRGGCFCNPGCAEAAFGLGAADPCLDALGADFTIPRLAACLGDRAVGAIRISLGLGSVRADVEAVLGFLERYLN
jgi:selenocysteine lyase/cysteine desulfurase